MAFWSSNSCSQWAMVPLCDPNTRPVVWRPSPSLRNRSADVTLPIGVFKFSMAVLLVGFLGLGHNMGHFELIFFRAKNKVCNHIWLPVTHIQHPYSGPSYDQARFLRTNDYMFHNGLTVRNHYVTGLGPFQSAKVLQYRVVLLSSEPHHIVC